MTAHIKFTHRKAAKRVSLRVDALRHVVTITAPRRHTDAQLVTLLNTNYGWIVENLNRHQPIPLYDGMSLPLLGRDVCLCLTQDQGGKRIELADDILTCRSPVPSMSLPRFLQEELRSYVADKVAAFSARIQVSYASIRIKKTRSRWGSCSQKGDLSFQWQLIFAPLAVLDYVIAHEVCHLKHFNHSPAFWAQVSTLDPDFQAHHRWLRTHGDRLHAYFAEGPLAKR